MQFIKNDRDYSHHIWDPDKDYGEEYCNVHFRIKTDLYRYPGFHFESEDTRLGFYDDVKKCLEPVGWKVKAPWEDDPWGSRTLDIVRGKESLYLHPQDFSGTVKKNAVREIADALSKGSLFKLEWVDIYETIHDFDEESSGEILEARKDDIMRIIWKESKTSRKDTYVSPLYICRRVQEDLDIWALGYDGPMKVSPDVADYVDDLSAEMINAGYLTGYKDADGSRLTRQVCPSQLKKKGLAPLGG